MTSRSKGSGMRSTRQRAAIINALQDAAAFKTAQALHTEMLSSGERVGLATVYRNLQSLAETGHVDVLQNEDGEAMFRLCEAASHHHHLVCRSCGHSEEIVSEEIERWAAQVARRHGFEDATHSAEIFGLCARCSAPAASPGDRGR